MFRLLDLGSHDGYVTLWLARKLRDEGHEVQVDGIDLMPQAVETANRRFKEDGFTANFQQGDALKPHYLFPERQYDAVVAFELIEHVVDPAQLLDPCERMLKEDGLVYISTPDGTFGTGNNPHHLHAYRAIDLADILRRRGGLSNMTVGYDGVTVASYKPHGRLGDIAIYCGPGWASWQPQDIELKGLGGSETAAVRLAQYLSRLGYVVTVYGEITDQQCFGDVIFRHHTAFDPQERREAVISSRIPELFDRPVNCRSRLLWFHDTDAGDRFTASQCEKIDHVLCLSDWHLNHLKGLYPFAADKLRQTRNGIEPRYFENGEVERNPHRAVYTSSPDRGLDKLLELWPRVREQVPDAELKHSYVDVYDAIAEQDPVIGSYRQKVKELADQPGVHSVGHLSQPEVAQLMRSAAVWCHPSWSTPTDSPFCETSCIGAMEAQSAGCLAVVSSVGALKETVLYGRRVEAEQLSDRWSDVFVKMIVEGMTNPQVQQWVQDAAPDLRSKWGWDGVARQIAGLINGEQWAF